MLVNTSEKILKEALSIYVDNDYDKMTLSRIAGNIGIKKPSIYSHYSNKEEIFMVILDTQFEYLNEFFLSHILNITSREDREELYSEIFTKIITYVMDDDTRKKFWHKVFFSPPINFKDNIKLRLNTFANQFINLMTTHIEYSYLNNNSDEKKRIIIDSFIGYIFGLISLMIYDSQLLTLENLDDYWRIYWNGIKTELE